jgi:hypothetical protein
MQDSAAPSSLTRKFSRNNDSFSIARLLTQGPTSNAKLASSLDSTHLKYKSFLWNDFLMLPTIDSALKQLFLLSASPGSCAAGGRPAGLQGPRQTSLRGPPNQAVREAIPRGTTCPTERNPSGLKKNTAPIHIAALRHPYTRKKKNNTHRTSPRRSAPPRGEPILPMQMITEGLRCTMNHCPSYKSLIIKKMPGKQRGVELAPPALESRALARRCSEPLTNTG